VIGPVLTLLGVTVLGLAVLGLAVLGLAVLGPIPLGLTPLGLTLPALYPRVALHTRNRPFSRDLGYAL